MFLPEHVGFPLGEDHGGSSYYLLEIHFDLTGLKKYIVDSSGLEIYMTPNLRQYDGGIMAIGSSVLFNFIIPPKVRFCHERLIKSKLSLHLF